MENLSEKTLEEQAIIIELLMDAAGNMKQSTLNKFVFSHQDVQNAIWAAVFELIEDSTAAGYFDHSNITDEKSAKKAMKDFMEWWS